MRSRRLVRWLAVAALATSALTVCGGKTQGGVASGSSTGTPGTQTSGAASGSVTFITSGSMSGAVMSGSVTFVTSGAVVSGSVSGAVVSGSVSGAVVSGSVSGAASGAVMSGSVTFVTSGAVVSGSVSGEASGAVVSGSSSGACPGPTRYIDKTGHCVCAGNAYSLNNAGPCTCQLSLPTLCTYAAAPPQCVDDTVDWDNCGGCGVTCKPTAACNGSTCGQEASTLVPAAPGCLSLRAVYDLGSIYWSDMGHGTISSVPSPATASGEAGTVTTIASGLHVAAVQTPLGPLMWPSGPLATALLVRAGTVYWIGASNPTTCPGDGGACSGGAGTMILSATAGTAPKTLLTMAMDPGPSPVSATSAISSIETPGQNPPINAIALSPDGGTLYFAAGTRFYSIPSTGAGAVTYVGYAEGPEHGEATALVTDGTYLYYPTNLSGNVEILPIGQMCDPDAAVNETCPYRIAESQGELVFDNITVKGGSLYWGNGASVIQGSVALAVGGRIGGADYPGSFFGTSLTGFAVGTRSAYFGEPGSDNAGYIEKGFSPSLIDASAPYPNTVVIARGQPTPTSFVLDGTNVYWTTDRCDISYIEDSPQ